jgi:hypothetical protein
VGNDTLEWVGILAGPSAWLTQFLINYALVREACIGHHNLALHVVSGVFFAVVVAAGILSTRYFFKTREFSAASEKLPARSHFMAALGILSSSLYTLIILAQAIPSFILDPCQR